LLKLGLESKKSKRLNLPKIPLKYFSDFIRGYFDGDGNVVVYYRDRRMTRNKKSAKVLRSGFTSGTKNFLSEIKNKLFKIGIVNGGTLYYSSRAWRLYFSVNDSKSLYYYMYNEMNGTGKLFLERKKSIFEKFIKN
jgi:intein-encoded DNA endonuclease-like protein